MVSSGKETLLLKLIPIAGWIYIAVGLIWPFENAILYVIWIIDLFLSVVVHSLQLIVAIPIGKRLEIPMVKTVFFTLVFGATWWKPLQARAPEV